MSIGNFADQGDIFKGVVEGVELAFSCVLAGLGIKLRVCLLIGVNGR